MRLLKFTFKFELIIAKFARILCERKKYAIITKIYKKEAKWAE